MKGIFRSTLVIIICFMALGAKCCFPPCPVDLPSREELIFECARTGDCDVEHGYLCCDGICKKSVANRCPPAPTANLYFKKFDVSNRCFVLGDEIDIVAQVANTGDANTAGPFDVAFFISGNSTFEDADDLLLGSYRHTETIPANGVGPEFNVRLRTTVRNLSETYYDDAVNYIGMKIDSQNEVAERNENDNIPESRHGDCRDGCRRVVNPFVFPEDARDYEGPYPHGNARAPYHVTFYWKTIYARGYGCAPIIVRYKTEGETAQSSIDFIAKRGEAIFRETSHGREWRCIIDVETVADHIPEMDETFKLYFTVQNAALLDNRRFIEDPRRGQLVVRGTIIDDD